MTRLKSIYMAVTLLVMLPVAEISGQDPFDLDEIKVVAPYEPSISDAFKIILNPRIEDTLDVNFDFTYNIFPRKIIPAYVPESISAARMRGEPLTRLYRVFVKGGYGNYSSPYFEGFYNSLRSNSGSLSLHLKHLSSGGGIPNVGHNAFSDNSAAINGQKFFRRTNIAGDLGYERNVLHYYGFKREDFENNLPVLEMIDSLSNHDIRQKFDLLSANIRFGSNLPDSTRIRHQNKVGYRFLRDLHDVTEHHVVYQGYLGRNIEADPFGLADKQHISLDLNAEYLNNMNLANTSSTYLLGLQPRLWSKYQKIQFYIGVNTVFQIDTASYFRAYPLLGAELNIISNKLNAFIQLSGNTEKHSMLSLMGVNPFLNTNIPYAFMNVKTDIGGGIKGAIGDIIGFSLSVNRAVIENHPFFVNDTSFVLNNRFSVVYDNVSRFNVRGNISAKFGERFSAAVTADHYQYGLTNETEAWHTPLNTISGSLRYSLQNKIIFSTEVFTRSKTFGRVFDENGEQSSAVAHPFHADINFGLEYRYTKNLSVFLNFSNVSNKSFERWLNYPTQRFNFLGGASFSF